MTQRIVFITGANSGIGKETAIQLARSSMTVVMGCRDLQRGEQAKADIQAISASADVDLLQLDLADFASIERCVEQLGSRYDQIDVLINNAGLMSSQRSVTAQGFETTFGVNHLGHFYLTSLLEPMLSHAKNARVINVASVGHWLALGGIAFEDLQSELHYNSWTAYCRSKLANILFANELALRWADKQIVVHSLHPGIVGSDFGGNGDTTGFDSGLVRMGARIAVSPATGSKTSVYLATQPEGADPSRTGTYWVRSRPGVKSPWARSQLAGRRLWEHSERLVAQGRAAVLNGA